MDKKVKHIKNLILLIAVFFIAFPAIAQDINVTPPTTQTVCVGTEVTYTVFGYPGSTIYFYVDGVQQEDVKIPDNTENVLYNGKYYNKVTFNHTWTTAKAYVLTAKEVALSGCESELLTLDVNVKPAVHPEISPKDRIAIVGREYVYTTLNSPANTYQWTASDQGDMQFKDGVITQSNVTATWNKAQTFQLKVTEDNGSCSAVDEIDVKVVDALHLLLDVPDANKCTQKNVKIPFEFTVKRDESYTAFEGTWSFRWKIVSGVDVLLEEINDISVSGVSETISVQLPGVTANKDFKVIIHNIKDSNDAAYIYPEEESGVCRLLLLPNPSEIKF